jgi:hypothetical protein
MGISSRMFLLDQDDHLYRLPNSTFERMRQDSGSHPITRFASQRVRMADLLVELLDRQPIRVVRSTYGIFTFNADGCFDLNTFERQQWARAEQALAPMSIEFGGKSTVVDAKTRFVAQGGQWIPSRALACRIGDAALERVTCTRLTVSGSQPTPSAR